MHPVGDAPIGDRISRAVPYGPPLREIIVEPDLQDRTAYFSIGEKWLDMRPDILEVTKHIHCWNGLARGGVLQLESAGTFRLDRAPFQAPVVHVGPPQVHAGELKVILPDDGCYLGQVFIPYGNHQRAARVHGGIHVEVNLIGEATHVPPVWVTHLVVIRYNDIVCGTGGTDGKFLDLAKKLLGIRSRMGIDQGLSGVIIVNEGGSEGIPASLHGQKAEKKQNGEARNIPEAPSSHLAPRHGFHQPADCPGR